MRGPPPRKSWNTFARPGARSGRSGYSFGIPLVTVAALGTVARESLDFIFWRLTTLDSLQAFLDLLRVLGELALDSLGVANNLLSEGRVS